MSDLGAILGTILGTTLSPEIPIAVFIAVYLARSWLELLGAMLIGFIAVMALRLVFLGVSLNSPRGASTIVATALAMIFWCVIGYGLRRWFSRPITDNT